MNLGRFVPHALEGRLSNPAVVLALYDAAAGQGSWTAALEALCAEFGAQTGVLMHDSFGVAAVPIATVGWSTTALHLYSKYYSALDPYQSALRRRPPGSEIVLGQDVISSTAFENSEIWLDYSKHHVGAFHFLGTSLNVSSQSLAGIGLHRPKDAKPFDDLARVHLESMARHLEGALRLNAKLDRSQGRLQAAILDNLSIGIIVVSRDGYVISTNKAAERLCRAGAVRFGSRRTPISLESTSETARLLKLINDAASGSVGGDMLVRPSGSNTVLALSVSPTPSSMQRDAGAHTDSREAGLLIVREVGNRINFAPGRLVDLFNLTSAEAAIVPLLLNGETANTIAAVRGVSPLTVQSQIRQILNKTGAATLRSLSTLLIPLRD